MLLPRPARRTARRIVGAALLALMLVQWLALAHAVLHAAHMRPALAFAAIEAVQADGFGHAAGTPECRLVDQLLSAGVAPAATPALPGAAPAVLAAALPPSPPACWTARPYQARAPPHA